MSIRIEQQSDDSSLDQSGSGVLAASRAARFLVKLTGYASVAAVAVALAGASVQAAEMESSIARGGMLYDKWYKVIDIGAPATAHPLYPTDKKYAEKPAANWRCKECHGWDYRGKDGAYASGKHASGIGGIAGMKGAAPAKVVALLKNGAHGFGDKLNAADMADLANFVTAGQLDMDAYIDRATKKPKGDAAKGAAYYNTICANCHGLDGKLPKDMAPLGKLMGNPWEIMHKVLNGQPGEKMPALRALDRQIVVDIMSHMTTLPKE